MRQSVYHKHSKNPRVAQDIRGKCIGLETSFKKFNVCLIGVLGGVSRDNVGNENVEKE